jgi:YVTN family beta-propeller protein
MGKKTIIGAALLLTFFTNCKERTKSETRPLQGDKKSDIEEWVYITNEDSEDLSIISTLTNEVVATIPFGKRPRGIRIAPDGKSVFVAIKLSSFPLRIFSFTLSGFFSSFISS